MIKKIIKLSIICLSSQVLASGGDGFSPYKGRFLDKRAKSFEKSDVSDRVEYVQGLYYEVNGYPDGYDQTGKPQPYLELINYSLGEYGLGGDLYSLDYKSCESIPDSGTESAQSGSTLTFSSPTKSVPSYYITDSSSAMDKKIVVVNGTNTIEAQLKCNDDSTIQTGYLRLLDSVEPDIIYEGYFQQNTTTGAVNVDIYIKTKNGSGELLVATQFSTVDGENFSILSAFVNMSTSGTAYVTAVKGIKNGKAEVRYLSSGATSGADYTTPPHQFVDSTVGYINCVDVPTVATATDCDSLTAPGSLSIGGVTNTWTIQTLKQVSL